MRLSEVTAVTTAIKDTDSVLIEVSGNIRRVTIENFRKVINSADAQLLNSSAFGFTIDSSTDAGTRTPAIVGSSAVREAYMAQVGRYFFKKDVSVMAKLMSTDSTKFANGTVISKTAGDCMVRLPKLYYKVVVSSTKTTVWLSPNPISDKFFDETFVGAYLGYKDSSNYLRSVSGYANTVNQTMETFFTYAKNHNADYGLMSYKQLRHIIMLFIANYKNIGSNSTKSIDCQSLIGFGVTGNNATPNNTTVVTNGRAVAKSGVTDSLGDATGKIDVTYANASGNVTNASNISLFGIENLWGLCSQFIQGIYFGKSANSAQDGTEVFEYSGNRLPTTDELSTHPNGDYRQFVRLADSGRAKKMLLGDFCDFIGTDISGTNTTYYCDYQLNDLTLQYMVTGGYIGTNYDCGIFGFNSSFGGANSNWGARLAYFGKTPKLVDSF